MPVGGAGPRRAIGVVRRRLLRRRCCRRLLSAPARSRRRRVAAQAQPPASRRRPASNSCIGVYLAGRQAQQSRDFASAASAYEKAIAADPDSPELITRTFLMEVCVGNFDRAAALAPKELKLDPSDAVAQLVLIVDRVKAGDTAGALKQAAALPSEGVHRFVGPFALAWTRMAAGDLAGADTALQGLDKFNGFQPLKVFQLGLLYDFAGNAAQGAGILRQGARRQRAS